MFIRSSRHLSVLTAAILLLILSFSTEFAYSEDDPSISLVKTLVVREVDGLPVNTEEYIVEKGDSVARLLVKRGAAAPGPIPRELLKIVMALNPEMRDPNLIFIGQKLILPSGPIQGMSLEAPPSKSSTRPEPAPKAKTAGKKAAAKPKPPVEASAPKPQKTVSAGKPKFKTVTIKSGDSLAQLLRNEGIPEALIFNEYLELLKKINPEITNPNVIYAGQRVRVPLEADWAEASLSEKTKPEAKPAPGPKTAPVMTKIPAVTTMPLAPSKPREIIPPPQLPPARTVAARTALSLIFTRLGERVIAKGQHFLPLKTGGQITINTQSFPIIELQSGQRIVLDLDLRLPQNMVEIIRANWSNYTIFRPEHEKNLAEMLNRLLEIGQYYKVKSAGPPWVSAGAARISLGADWIVWPTQNDWLNKRAVAINMPPSKALGTSPEVAAFLKTIGIKVIDFYPHGNMIGPEPLNGKGTQSGQVRTIDAENVQKLIQAVLELLGQKYEPHLSIPLMQSQNSSQDFILTVEAPIYFSRGGKNFVIDLDGSPKEMKALLKKFNFQVVSREPGEGPELFLRKLLQAMNVPLQDGLTIKASKRPDDRNIAITFPGFVFRASGRKILLTHKQEPAGLDLLMAQPGLQVVQYNVINPT